MRVLGFKVSELIGFSGLSFTVLGRAGIIRREAIHGPFSKV